MSKYQEFDAAVISNIKYGYSTFQRLFMVMEGYCNDLRGEREPFRVLDGRLQSLRKRGLISHRGDSWKVE